MESIEMVLERYNDWMIAHYEELIEKYPHKAITIVEGEIVAVGSTEKEVEDAARKKYPDKIPFAPPCLRKKILYACYSQDYRLNISLVSQSNIRENKKGGSFA